MGLAASRTFRMVGGLGRAVRTCVASQSILLLLLRLLLLLLRLLLDLVVCREWSGAAEPTLVISNMQRKTRENVASSRGSFNIFSTCTK